MLGVLLVSDIAVLVQASGVMYTTTANLTIAYNVGAAAGMMLGVQVASGVVIAMSYVASEDASFSMLDGTTYSERY